MSSPPSSNDPKNDVDLSSSSSSSIPKPQTQKIPGEYGRPFFGPIKDRLDYFYFQGREEFFRSRMLKYQSSVFRGNMPPGPFISPNSKVIILLDAISFPVLFDLSKVDKKDVLDGTYLPSLSFTGGYRPCAYLDPSEPHHSKLKCFFFSILSSRRHTFIPLFQSTLASHLFDPLELHVISNKDTANFNNLSDNLCFDFAFRLFFNKNPAETIIGSNGLKIVTKWLLFQVAPVLSLGSSNKLLNFFEDLIFHTFPLPWFPVKSGYNKLYKAIHSSSSSILDEAQRMGIDKDEACHNLVFMAIFNAYGGMKAWFPSLIKWVGLAGPQLHQQLVNEIRAIVKAEGVTPSSLEKMTLTKSTVYEALRMEPAIPYQYARAKRDFVIESHENAVFEVKEGEMLFGYQPFATKDPKVFERAEEFLATRFVGDGEKLLKYVYWSNGRESENPTVENKQCPAKDLVVLLSRLMLTEFFLRYDTFAVEVGSLPLGSSVTVTSLTKASSNH
ncbi:hypothetical protein Scep_000832 [Stephania cephalantha]|uniref:Allene oxide synthase n=1 Tax=Stephania cephalantha TaxID=152367 RepID=A0AAP0Q741_9MAGN